MIEPEVLRARARIGHVLKGKYRLDGVLGVGAIGAVYAATHLRKTSGVAVKILHEELSRDEGLRERFLREGYAANSVGHPGTVRILDDDTSEDQAVFLVMDLLEGETLDARWARQGHRLRDCDVADLMVQLLDVLAAAHAKGIVHGDIKPDNLFLTREGLLKVLDFGVTRLREGLVAATRTAGGLLGTPAFMAPEQVLGKSREVDAQSDLWAVGATAFTLTSGLFVHEGETVEEMLMFTGSRPARSLASVAPNVAPALAHIVDRALMFKKSERWPDARSMQGAIEKAYPKAQAASAADDDLENRAVPTPATGTDPLEDDSAVAVTAPTGSTPVSADSSPDAFAAAARPAPPSPTVPTRPISFVGVVSDSIAGQRAPATPRRAGPSMLVLAAVGVLGAIAGSILVAMAVSYGRSHSDTITSATSVPPTLSASAQLALTTFGPDPAVPAIKPPPVAVEVPPPTPAAPTSSGAARPPSPKPIATAPPLVIPPGPATASHTKAGCTPPYTVDPTTGKKNWRVECL